MSHLRRLLLKEIYVGEIAGSYTSEEINLDEAQGFAIVASASPMTIANKTFTSSEVSLSTVTISAHGYALGLKVRFTTTGSLPSGLSAGVDYYLTPITSNTFIISTSYENVLSGSYVTLSDGGSGTHTVVVQDFVPVNMHLEGSIDGSIWCFINNSTKELNETPYMLEHESAFYHKVRIKLSVYGGQHDVNVKIMIKGGPF